jgi:hypothetical protein
VTVDAERPWINPFHEFLKAAEDVLNHYRELSKTNFENTLAQKWVVESLMAAARVHWALLMHPPDGTEGHIDDVDDALRWLISWLPGFFPEQNQPPRFNITEAADSLACLGINLLEHDRIETAEACASAIAGLATNTAAQHAEPYILADLHERLEILARAADALGKAPVAANIRAMMQQPATINDADWPHFLEARRIRFGQLDDGLQECRRHPYALRDDPVAELQRVLKTSGA